MERTDRNSENSTGLHVIFGTGPVGLTLADELLARGKRVRLVNRTGKAPAPAGVELVAADATNADAAIHLCQGAAVVYHCANVSYAQQYEVMPQLQKSREPVLPGVDEPGQPSPGPAHRPTERRHTNGVAPSGASASVRESGRCLRRWGSPQPACREVEEHR
jgi:hypothetical protein